MKRVITSSTNFITTEDAAKDTAIGMDVLPTIISELKDTALFSHAYSAILTILRQNERVNYPPPKGGGLLLNGSPD